MAYPETLVIRTSRLKFYRTLTLFFALILTAIACLVILFGDHSQEFENTYSDSLNRAEFVKLTYDRVIGGAASVMLLVVLPIIMLPFLRNHSQILLSCDRHGICLGGKQELRIPWLEVKLVLARENKLTRWTTIYDLVIFADAKHHRNFVRVVEIEQKRRRSLLSGKPKSNQIYEVRLNMAVGNPKLAGRDLHEYWLAQARHTKDTTNPN